MMAPVSFTYVPPHCESSAHAGAWTVIIRRRRRLPIVNVRENAEKDHARVDGAGHGYIAVQGDHRDIGDVGGA
jgi:hypothetical protein